MTTRYRATVAYDGTAYQGFQRQAGATPTVQLALEDAIAATTTQRVTVIPAGRTDSGVHATGQVIAFDVTWQHEDEALLRAINARLPEDIALQDIAQQPGFHPRYDALSRVYIYRVIQAARPQPLLRRQTWRVHQPLDMVLMQQAAGLLIGEHDFATFGQPPQGNNTVRTVMQSLWQRDAAAYGAKLTYTIEANAFLYRMVRRVVGMLVDVGRGLLSSAEFEAAFRKAELSQAGTIAPPQGLTLAAVRYPQQDV